MASRGRPERGTIDDHLLLEDHPLVMAAAAGLWALGLSLFVALAIPAQAARVQRLDDAVWRWAVDAEWAPLVALAKVLDFLGSAWVTLPLMVAIAFLLAWRRRWKAFTLWVVATAASQLLIGQLKGLYERSRPPLPLVPTTDFSFPSGHAVVTTVIAVGLVIVFVPAGPRRRNLELLAAFFAVVMAASRVYLRAHWATDTVAGAALGAVIVILTAAVVSDVARRVRARRALTAGARSMPSARQTELLAADPFARSLGIRLLSAGQERVVVALAIEPDHLHDDGRLRQAVAFALADCAMSLISNAETRAFAVAAHFVVTGSAAPGQTMTATAVPGHRTPGRVTWDIRVAVGDAAVATFTGTTLEVPA